MQRIATGDGRFAAGNPANGTPGTMVTSLYMNDLQDEVCNLIEGAGLTLDPADKTQLLKAVNARIAQSSMLVVPTTPTEQIDDVGLIFVKDRLNFQTWVDTAYYTGYRSLNCGRFTWGTTTSPRPGEIEAEGDIIDGDDEPSLIAYFQENGLTKPIANWTAGTWILGVMGDGTYRLPDMRNMFVRATGTDADTANARALGSKQLDAVQKIVGAAGSFDDSVGFFSGALYKFGPASFDVTTSPSGNGINLGFDSSKVARSSTETRGPNTALAPMLFL